MASPRNNARLRLVGGTEAVAQKPAREPGAASALDDASLVSLARDGHASAFEALYRRHAGFALNVAARIQGNTSDVEDVVHDAFLRAWRHLDRFQAGRPFRPWLLTVARHAATDLLRTRGKEQRTASRAAPPEPRGGSAEAEAARAEARERARRALLALPLETRALLVQRHGLGAPLQELAESWDVTERTIRNRLRAAAEQLAVALTQDPQTRNGARA